MSRLVWIGLLVPAVLYAAVTLLWLQQRAYPITGDEPHYLMISESLLRDGDLYVANNYAAESPVTRELGRAWTQQEINGHSRGFSLHHPALGLWLLPAYALGGVAGARIFLAVASGLLFALLFYHIALSELGTRGWALVLAVITALNLPFLVGANRPYADLTAGILILHAAWLVVRGFQRKSISRRALVLVGIEAGILTWLHIRFPAPALILVAFAVWAALAAGARREAALPVLAVFPFYLLLALYHWIAYQNIFGPFGAGWSSYDWHPTLMIALGLHWDSLQGIFFQAPWLLFGWLGIVPFVRANPRGALCVLLVYLAVILPNSLHFNWYGGATLVGRYAWAAVGLWVFPLVYAFQIFLSHPWGKYVIGGVAAASLALQALLAPIWLTDGFLVNRGVGMPQWTQQNLYTALLSLSLQQQWYLPYFGNFATYLDHLPNLLWVIASALLVVLGYALWAQKRTVLWGTLILLLAVAAAFGFTRTPLPEKIVWRAEQLKSSVGRLENGQRAAVPGEAGILAATPQLKFYPELQYRLTLTYRTDNKLPGRSLLVFNGNQNTLLQYRLRPTNGARQDLTIATPPDSENPIPPPHRSVEFWVYYKGSGALEVEQISVEPLLTDNK